MSRTLPTECPHGKILDWGDFGPDSDDGTVGVEPCSECDRPPSRKTARRAVQRQKAEVRRLQEHLTRTIDQRNALRDLVREWLAQVADCDLGPTCNCCGHDDLLILQMESLMAVEA